MKRQGISRAQKIFWMKWSKDHYWQQIQTGFCAGCQFCYLQIVWIEESYITDALSISDQEDADVEIIKMKLSDLVKPEKNVRIHTEQQLKEFQRSINMFGQIRPIVIDENNTILAGNGLYDTLIAMGKDTADVYQYNHLTENQKKKLMIADNKIFSLGIENLDTLNCFLEELQGDLDIPGFDEGILKQMVADAEDVTDKIAEYGTLDDEAEDEGQCYTQGTENTADGTGICRRTRAGNRDAGISASGKGR